MMKKETTTLGYENITLSTLFLERVETGVDVWERQAETKSNCHIYSFFLTTLCHTEIQGRISFLLWRNILNWFSTEVHLTLCGHSVDTRLQTNEWRLKLKTAVGCCNSWLSATLGYLCIFNFITPSGSDSCELFGLFTLVHHAITLFTQLEHPSLSRINMQHILMFNFYPAYVENLSEH